MLLYVKSFVSYFRFQIHSISHRISVKLRLTGINDGYMNKEQKAVVRQILMETLPKDMVISKYDDVDRGSRSEAGQRLPSEYWGVL